MHTDHDRNVDLRGLYCPEPIFRTAAEIGEMEREQILEVLAGGWGLDRQLVQTFAASVLAREMLRCEPIIFSHFQISGIQGWRMRIEDSER